MDKEKTIFDYCSITLTQFGFTIFVMSIFCVLVGESAKGVSAMFRLGGEGLSIAILLQFFLLSCLTTALRVVFFTDLVIKKMSIAMRAGLMLTGVLLLVGSFIVVFDWFPTDYSVAWVMFLVCFGISTAGTMLILSWKERMENRKMEKALKKLQGEDYE